MTHPDKETLSQLMDGEWQDIDSQARISELCSSPELQATWARYHLIRDVMKNESVKVDGDIASLVSAALKDEPAHSNVTSIAADRPVRASTSATVDVQQTQTKRPAWRSAVGGLAVAASVALATVLGLNFMNDGSQNAPQTVTAFTPTQANPILPGQVLPQIELVANRGTYWVSTSTEDRNANREQRLNIFLSQHIEESPTANHQGMLPYSRLVGYDVINTDSSTGQ